MECGEYTGVCVVFFFFFKQKTAYEMRISDWSSDVCSSDLAKMLAGAGIVRTHRSALCRRDAVVALARSRYGALQTRMQSGALIPVGRNHRHAVMALMKSRSDVPG